MRYICIVFSIQLNIECNDKQAIDKFRNNMAQTTRILVERGETSRLAKLYRVSTQTVRQALIFATTTELAENIRKDAIKGGGMIYKKKVRA